MAPRDIVPKIRCFFILKEKYMLDIKLIRENPELVKRAYDEGHFIANHGYNHNNSKLYKNDDSFINEIKNTDIEIGNAIRCFKLLLTCI